MWTGARPVVKDFGGQEPTSTVSLDASAVQPAGGRAHRLRSAPTDVRYGGDEEVGKRVVEHLNYVI